MQSKGMSAIEALVALAIFAGACVGFLAVTARSVRAVDTSATEIQASYLLEEGLERARLARDAGWYSPPSDDTTGRFSRSYAVEDAGLDLKRVIVILAWQEYGVSRSRSLRTIIGHL